MQNGASMVTCIAGWRRKPLEEAIVRSANQASPGHDYRPGAGLMGTSIIKDCWW